MFKTDKITSGNKMSKILIVEDDVSLSEILQTRFQAEGYQAVTAHNGREGFNLAMSQKPDLIIADIMMPLLSGFEMIKALHLNPATKDIRVIIYTALGSEQDKELSASLGVSKYLVKSQSSIDNDLVGATKELLTDQALPNPRQIVEAV